MIRLEDEPIGKSGFTANVSGYRDAADCGRQYLDIKNKKRRWGYTKTGTPVSCELISVIDRSVRVAGCEAESFGLLNGQVQYRPGTVRTVPYRRL